MEAPVLAEIGRAEKPEERVTLLRGPFTRGSGGFHEVAVCPYAILIQIVQCEPQDYRCIICDRSSVTAHLLQLVRAAMIISFAIASECAVVNRSVDVDGASRSVRLWNMDEYDRLSVHIHSADILVCEDVDADFLPIVQVVPQFLHDFCRIPDSDCFETAVIGLLQSQGYDSSE